MEPFIIAIIIDIILLILLFLSCIAFDNEVGDNIRITIIVFIAVVSLAGIIIQVIVKPETIRIKSNHYNKELYEPKDTIEFEGYKYVKLK